jgi:hypothetical protein
VCGEKELEVRTDYAIWCLSFDNKFSKDLLDILNRHLLHASFWLRNVLDRAIPAFGITEPKKVDSQTLDLIGF